MTEHKIANSWPELNIESEEHHSLDNIFFLISDARYPCCHQNKACNECSIYDGQKSWRVTSEPSCKDILKSRDDHMFYLADRVYQAAVNGKLELWDLNLENVIPFPVHKTENKATESQIKDWIKSAYILQSDLETFCTSIRFKVLIRQGNEIDNDVYKLPADTSDKIAESVQAHEVEPSELQSIRQETHAERKLRLQERLNELKAQGVLNFRQRVADEEGVTPGRITQIVGYKGSEKLRKY